MAGTTDIRRYDDTTVQQTDLNCKEYNTQRSFRPCYPFKQTFY